MSSVFLSCRLRAGDSISPAVSPVASTEVTLSLQFHPSAAVHVPGLLWDTPCHAEYRLLSSLPAERPLFVQTVCLHPAQMVSRLFHKVAYLFFSHLCLLQPLCCNFFYDLLMPLSNPTVCPPVVWLLTVGSRIPSLPNDKGKFIQQAVLCWHTSQAMPARFVPLAVSLRGTSGGGVTSKSMAWLGEICWTDRRTSWRRQALWSGVGLQPPALHHV